MKTLFLLRHAKSSWDNANLTDFERPLNARGLKAAPFMGGLIGKNLLQPDLILSSPAERAKQTALLVKEAARIKNEIRYEEKIYEANSLALIKIISELDDKIETVLLVGHNPGLEGLIKFLTSEGRTLPTAALAEINLNVRKWSEVKSNCGQLKRLIRPKDEMKNLSAD